MGIELDFSGRGVMITGAGAGVGRAIALAFAQAGASVSVCDTNAAGLQETLELLQAQGVAAHAQVADICDAEQMQQWLDSACAAIGTVGTLVNNAAVITRVGSFAEIDPACWERDVRIGLLGTMCCTRVVVRDMLARGQGGAIVNIASDAGRAGNANAVGYSSTKGGVIAFTKALAQEVGPSDIRVNAVSPGSVDAPMRDQILDDIRQRLGAEALERREAQRLAQVPLRRVSLPQDIAHTVLFLASPLSRQVTGQVLSVNGGLRMY